MSDEEGNSAFTARLIRHLLQIVSYLLLYPGRLVPARALTFVDCDKSKQKHAFENVEGRSGGDVFPYQPLL